MKQSDAHWKITLLHSLQEVRAIYKTRNQLYDNLTIHYGCKEGKYGKFKIKILDNKTNFIVHQEVMDVSHGLRFWTNFGYCKSFIYDAVTIVFEVEGKKVVEQHYMINATPPHHAFLDFWCDQDLELYSYYEIFF